ncbi:MAG: type 1 glutamine amidotransferase [Nitrospirae bacterium]|nr:type 1 glutamine amidotransferase [Nitrospirota bacterium]
MSVLICKNIITEGPGTIEDYLKLQKISYCIVDLSAGVRLLAPDAFDTLVMMGGPMSVNEDNIYTYIKDEETLVRDFISKGKKVLGVCLGAQIMAKALGAKVYAGPQKESGWYNIGLTEDGLKDELFSSLLTLPGRQAPDLAYRQAGSGLLTVFHWHGETFDIPEGAVRLASSELYPNQAFKYGKNAYAFQFHIEVTRKMITDWLRDAPDFQKIEKDSETFYREYSVRAEKFYEKFFTH